MPLHLLGKKKSWNVYNPANIAKVKADEAAAAAREAAEDQRLQEIDAERRAAILRGQTPPPLPEDEDARKGKDQGRRSERDGHDRKRRRLAGEDDTDRDIRLARTFTEPSDHDQARILKLRKPKSDAPLADHAGNINLFPMDLKEAIKKDKNAESEAEKKRKEQALEDQYTMRFSNAAGREGLESPWYADAGSRSTAVDDEAGSRALEYSGFESKNVWGREDPQRKEREMARMTSTDPLAFMNRAQTQLKRSKDDRKKWKDERGRELMEMRAAEEREKRRDRHGKHRKRHHDDIDASTKDHHRESHSKHRDGRSRRRSRSREHRRDRSDAYRHERHRSSGRSRSRDRDRERENHSGRDRSR